MSKQLQVGDAVRLIAVPAWLVHDLPSDEQSEIRACVGKATRISQIDDLGYYWVGFGGTEDAEDGGRYSGHTFCVSADCLELLEA